MTTQNRRKKIQAIIPLAGSGTRLKSKAPKSLLKLNGKAMLIYVLEAMDQSRWVDAGVVVTQKKFFKIFEELIKAARIRKPYRLVEGGKTRDASVDCGLKSLDDDVEIVVVHDGARPLVTAKLVDDCVRQAKKYRAVVAAVPVKPTIKRVENQSRTVEATLDRSRLWEIQTPQVFEKKLLVQAYQSRDRASATDDASLVERMGVPVKVVLADYANLKITTREDVVMAEALLKRK